MAKTSAGAGHSEDSADVSLDGFGQPSTAPESHAKMPRRRERVRAEATVESCAACHASKVKCDDEKPCKKCVKYGCASSCVPWRLAAASAPNGLNGTQIPSQGSVLGSNPENWTLSEHVSNSNLVFEKLIAEFRSADNSGSPPTGAQGPRSRKREQCGTSKACAACRASKIKCDDQKPCKNCIRFKRDDCVPGDSAAKRQRDDATLDSPRSRKEVAQLLSASLSTNPEPAFLFSPDIEKTESVPFGSSVTSLLRGASSAAASAPFGSSSTSLLKGGSFSTSHSSLFSNSFSNHLFSVPSRGSSFNGMVPFGTSFSSSHSRSGLAGLAACTPTLLPSSALSSTPAPYFSDSFASFLAVPSFGNSSASLFSNSFSSQSTLDAWQHKTTAPLIDKHTLVPRQKAPASIHGQRYDERMEALPALMAVASSTSPAIPAVSAPPHPFLATLRARNMHSDVTCVDGLGTDKLHGGALGSAPTRRLGALPTTTTLGATRTLGALPTRGSQTNLHLTHTPLMSHAITSQGKAPQATHDHHRYTQSHAYTNPCNVPTCNITTPSNGVAGFEIGMPRAALTRGVFPAGASLQVWHGLP
mmetsp:Transcript_5863/g.9392  ORF Transcript_5863/g.9392 Transcript_5863/m.9392 type:complete len:587 (-) Transcript_5863:339-2099(-)